MEYYRSIFLGPKDKISDALEIMARYHISGVPNTVDGKLVRDYYQ